jgi:hypothetical protein
VKMLVLQNYKAKKKMAIETAINLSCGYNFTSTIKH